MKYRPWMWPVCFMGVFGGAWLTDKTRSGWGILLMVASCAASFYIKKLEDREERERRYRQFEKEFWEE